MYPLHLEEKNAEKFTAPRFPAVTKNVKDIRRANLVQMLFDRGVAKQDLAEQLGKKPTQISHWVAGRREISEEVARDIEKLWQLPHMALDFDRSRDAVIKVMKMPKSTELQLMEDCTILISQTAERLKIKVQPEKFGRAVRLSYERALELGRVDKTFIENLLQFLL